MSHINLPRHFQKNIANTYGEKGLSWLSSLDSTIKYAIKKYNLSNIQALPNLSYNYVTTAKQKDNHPVIIKFCFPGSENNNEIEALHLMQGDGMIRLLEHDKEHGLLLLEQCQPGETLASVTNDLKATRIAANVIKNIQKPISEPLDFPTTQDWFRRLESKIILPPKFKTQHIDKAKCLAYALHNQSRKLVLLHGDLHHFNILSAQRQPWLAIDPKGVIGPPEYECGAFLRNPIPQVGTQAGLKKILTKRIEVFAEMLEFDKQIILSWAYSQAILASVWCLDMRSDDWRVFLTCAEALDRGNKK